MITLLREILDELKKINAKLPPPKEPEPERKPAKLHTF